MKNIILSLIFIYPATNLGFSQEKYRIGIGFYNICCGTSNGKPMFDYIKTLKKTNKIKNIHATLVSTFLNYSWWIQRSRI